MGSNIGDERVYGMVSRLWVRGRWSGRVDVRWDMGWSVGCG